jgi:hypothetical protein
MSGLRADFERFHAENPHVYRLFEQFAIQAAGRRPRFSARTILHRIRWYTSVETDDPTGLKINDHWSPFYARLFEAAHPHHAGFFEKRTAAADGPKAHGFDGEGQGVFL